MPKIYQGSIQKTVQAGVECFYICVYMYGVVFLCCVELLQKAEGGTSPNHTPESYPLKRKMHFLFLPFVLFTASATTTTSATYY